MYSILTTMFSYDFRRYSIFVGNHAILDYLDFIENWYRDHCEEIPAKEMEAFNNKLDGIRREWPSKVCSLRFFEMCDIIIAVALVKFSSTYTVEIFGDF